MKSLAIFLVLLVPLAWFLWNAGGGSGGPERLPERPPAGELGPAVLEANDLADEFGRTPYAGKVRRLEDLVLRVENDGYVQYYLRIGRLARHDGKPRIESVSCAVFDPPEAGRPRLRMTFLAPQVSAEPAELIRAGKDTPRHLALSGGVEARDPEGRPVGRVQSLELDLTKKTATSRDPVTIRMPDPGATIRGRGLFADLALHCARIEHDVVVSLPGTGEGPIRLSCTGSATLTGSEDGAAFEVELRDGARIEHPAGEARCARITARAVRGERGLELTEVVLDGGVELHLDPAGGHGLEQVRFERARLEGRRVLDCEGPVEALWRGPVRALGLGERVIDLTAGRARLLLAGADGAGQEARLESVRFEDGFVATDREGAGTLRADSLHYDPTTGLLMLAGAVRAKTQDGSIAARTVTVATQEAETSVLVTGVESVEYFTDARGRLGPFGEESSNVLTLRASGDLSLTRKGDDLALRVERDVVATFGPDSRLACSSLELELQSGRLFVLHASGPVRLAARGAHVEGSLLDVSGKSASVTGSPAALELEQGRRLSAKRISYAEDGRYSAEGAVEARALVGRRAPDGDKKAWLLRCERLTGELDGEGQPRTARAEGGVVATGPDDALVKGSVLAYDAAAGALVLTGSPALVRRGTGFVMEAGGLDLLLDDDVIEAGRTVGAARLRLAPESKTNGFARWELDLSGAAQLSRDRIRVPQGARLRGFDDRDRLALRARAGEIALELERRRGRLRPSALLGRKGVEIESVRERGDARETIRVTADRLRYEPGTRRVDLFGNALVRARGWPGEVRFRHVVFVLTAKGIDLEKASEIEVRRPAR